MKQKYEEQLEEVSSHLVPDFRQSLRMIATWATRSELLPVFSEMMTAMTVVVTSLMVSGTPSASPQ